MEVKALSYCARRVGVLHGGSLVSDLRICYHFKKKSLLQELLRGYAASAKKVPFVFRLFIEMICAALSTEIDKRQ